MESGFLKEVKRFLKGVAGRKKDVIEVKYWRHDHSDGYGTIYGYVTKCYKDGFGIDRGTSTCSFPKGEEKILYKDLYLVEVSCARLTSQMCWMV
jgi:hypothetical protein